MGFLHEIFIALLCLSATAATAVVMQNNVDCRASFINGRPINIPCSLLTLEGGKYVVSLDGHEINVKLRNEGGKINPEFMIPIAFSADEDLNKIPIVKLLTEVLTLSAYKRQDVVVTSGQSEVLHSHINFLVEAFVLNDS